MSNSLLKRSTLVIHPIYTSVEHINLENKTFTVDNVTRPITYHDLISAIDNIVNNSYSINFTFDVYEIHEIPARCIYIRYLIESAAKYTDIKTIFKTCKYLGTFIAEYKLLRNKYPICINYILYECSLIMESVATKRIHITFTYPNKCHIKCEYRKYKIAMTMNHFEHIITNLMTNEITIPYMHTNYVNTFITNKLLRFIKVLESKSNVRRILLQDLLKEYNT